MNSGIKTWRTWKRRRRKTKRRRREESRIWEIESFKMKILWIRILKWLKGIMIRRMKNRGSQRKNRRLKMKISQWLRMMNKMVVKSGKKMTHKTLVLTTSQCLLNLMKNSQMSLSQFKTKIKRWLRTQRLKRALTLN